MRGRVLCAELHRRPIKVLGTASISSRLPVLLLRPPHPIGRPAKGPVYAHGVYLACHATLSSDMGRDRKSVLLFRPTAHLGPRYKHIHLPPYLFSPFAYFLLSPKSRIFFPSRTQRTSSTNTLPSTLVTTSDHLNTQVTFSAEQPSLSPDNPV